MLKTRVLTAVLIVAALLPSLFYLPQRSWALLTALITGIAAWEWGGLIRLGMRGKIGYGIAVSALCCAVVFLAPAAVGGIEPSAPAVPGILLAYGLAAVFWGLLVPLWLSRKWQMPGAGVGGAVGLVVMVPTWLALVQLRLPGPGVLLAILSLIWVADIAAYFAGKNFGRHKLAPSISPGKTWEGAVGAAIGVVAYGLALRHFLAAEAVATAWWGLALLAVTAVSVVGDLFESLLKRQSGLKDSSHILPGHGGVLDRIDSMTSTLPVVALLWLLSGFVSP